MVNSRRSIDKTTTVARVSPTDFDIVCGKGREQSRHIGNKRFLSIIAMHAEKYHGCGNQRKLKTPIVKAVLHEVRSTGARFFKKGDKGGGDDSWVEIQNKRVVRDKILHALRDIYSDGTLNLNQSKRSCSFPAAQRIDHFNSGSDLPGFTVEVFPSQEVTNNRPLPILSMPSSYEPSRSISLDTPIKEEAVIVAPPHILTAKDDCDYRYSLPQAPCGAFLHSCSQASSSVIPSEDISSFVHFVSPHSKCDKTTSLHAVANIDVGPPPSTRSINDKRIGPFAVHHDGCQTAQTTSYYFEETDKAMHNFMCMLNSLLQAEENEVSLLQEETYKMN